MDRQIFTQVAGAGDDEGNKIADRMRDRADARQRARLTKVFELMNVAAQQRRTFAKGSVVFHQGASADHFYIVNSGQLEMSLTTDDGRAVRVKRLGPGDHFGYDALLGAAHDTTVSCLTDVEVTAVPQDELRLASNSDKSGYLGETIKAQAHKRTAAMATAKSQQGEAQILPMMAKAAAAGGGVEYDKYEQMLAHMGTVAFATGDCVFRQGDPATSVYLVTAGKWEVGTETEPVPEPVGSGLLRTFSSSGGGERDDVHRARRERDRLRPVRDLRVIAHLGPGDHFGETALLEERKLRNTTVRCTSPACELREMPNEQFTSFMQQSKQLADSVHAAAVNRNNRRVRKVIKAAEDAGKASTITVKPGQEIFRQGDRSAAFYLVESGDVQMSITPAADPGVDQPPAPIPVRQYKAGDCFGASGLMPGDSHRRNTATALTNVTLKVIPHSYFRVMLRDDQFLKAGLQANDVLHAKRNMAEAYGAPVQAPGIGLAPLYDELDDEIVQKTMRK